MSCPHPETFNSMCVVCGQIVAQVATSSSGGSSQPAARSILVNGNVLTVSTAHCSGEAKLLSLQRTKRLVLVLDIDCTLLHCVQIDGPSPKGSATVQHNGEIHHLPLDERDALGRAKHLVIKKRPHLDHFLCEAHKFCEMTIYTAGNRLYAEAVVKVLDPEGKYFGRRIVSRSDKIPVAPGVEGTERVRESLGKSLEKAFLQEEALAVILDDREDVWRGKQAEQLLKVRAYEYFFVGAASAREVGAHTMAQVNNAPGSSAVPRGPNGEPLVAVETEGEAPAEAERVAPIIRLHGRPGEVLGYAPPTSPSFTERDDQLLRSLEVLRSLHSKYYRDLEANRASGASIGSASQPLHIGRHIAAMKAKALSGYTVTFSGIFPVNLPHPERHELWQLAVSLGASVTSDVHERTTHLLSLQPNTRKAAQCLARGDVWVIHPDWLQHCRWALAHVEERAFLLLPHSNDQPLPNPQRCLLPIPKSSCVTSNSISMSRKRERDSDEVRESAYRREIVTPPIEPVSIVSVDEANPIGPVNEGKSPYDTIVLILPLFYC